MIPVISTLARVLWPPAAPVAETHGRGARRWWVTTCVLLVLPATAVLHHGLFYQPSCILNPFGPDYHLPTDSPKLIEKYGGRAPTTAAVWLMNDPSLSVAVVLCTATFFLGTRLPTVRRLAAPAFVASLPLTVWIWDIPFSGRWVCDHFHDRKFELVPGLILRTLHIYALSLALYLMLLGLVLWKERRQRERVRAGFEVLPAR